MYEKFVLCFESKKLCLTTIIYVIQEFYKLFDVFKCFLTKFDFSVHPLKLLILTVQDLFSKNVLSPVFREKLPLGFVVIAANLVTLRLFEERSLV